MNKRLGSKCLTWITGLLLMTLLFGCGGEGKKISCTLAVYTDDGVIMEETEVTFTEGQTVLDILKKATREQKIQMEYTGVGITAYVKGIDNLYEFDKGPESGWKYSINGEDCSESAGAVKPEEGDAVVWRYVLTS